MKEFRQHQPCADPDNDVASKHLYTFLYMEGDIEFYCHKNREIERLGRTRKFREKDSKLIVLLTTN